MNSERMTWYKHHVILSLFILHTLHPALEDGTDRGFRNVGKPQSDAGEIPNTTSLSHYLYFILYIQPLKMELIEGSETSANHNRKPGKYPKEYIQKSLRIKLFVGDQAHRKTIAIKACRHHKIT